MVLRSKIVECVPNFSEGQDASVIDAISTAIRQTTGCTLLNVDPGASTNRTVYTFVGSPDAVIEGALSAARVAHRLIDMSKHKGEHARLGALDVCPFIPVRGVEMEECIYCACKFAEKLSSELRVPVYLYGYAARQDYRRTVPQIRSGEYEGLANKLELPEWKPDYGPSEFVPSWGATMSGARKFLIAYNVNLISTKEQAHKLALNIREDGRGPSQPGIFKKLQAVGWWLQEHNIAQVSCNILDNDITAFHEVFEEITNTPESDAGCGRILHKKEKLFILEDNQRIHLVINRLGLASLSPFVAKERIIEYMLDDDTSDLLMHKSVKEFVHQIGARTVAPGGGTVAAACATMGAALAAMVGKLSYGRKAWEHLDEPMRKHIPIVHQAMEDLMPLIDADSDAYKGIVAANRLPKTTAEEEAMREESIQAAVKHAIHVPLCLCRTIDKLWPTVRELAKIINVASRTDLQVGVKVLETASFGGYFNILTNCDDLADDIIRRDIIAEAERLKNNAQAMCSTVLGILDHRAKTELSQN
ncbi:LOW QUALITY PROTEIN: formimidoyltransferase-cyclodeaminase-like [Galendromus occidentalis]|uniref:Formimidoyltransferase-cyclodeaminase n=1 Tax=Galendromus occidentalis TaxID=34638 RepID=A0AAJ7WK84_9ACAR|nr:LOW QUALITY PROTEIN: formimidoyltransferase-cyclodeaminase-like [Galendromus occidentalis]